MMFIFVIFVTTFIIKFCDTQGMMFFCDQHSNQKQFGHPTMYLLKINNDFLLMLNGARPEMNDILLFSRIAVLYM